MEVRHDFLVPDYYPAFSCKMGACRSACCEGWPISVSMTDYFTLLGVDCSPELRRKLDCAMHLADHPSPEAYAQISPRFDGQCPMRLPDGRCGIHAELGEGALAAVCRLYPRCVHVGDGYECCCANSCEAVPELFWEREAPITFEHRTLTFTLPDGALRAPALERFGREQETGLWFIGWVQKRAYPLPQRILLVGEALEAMEEVRSAHDPARADKLLAGREALGLPAWPEPGPDQLDAALETMRPMLDIMDRGSDSIRRYGECALALFSDGAESYRQAARRFREQLPHWETWFEHLLVNHLFFTRFPFQDPAVPLYDKFLGLCAVYALLRFLCVGWMAGHTGRDAAVDVAAGAFRLIDHTDFDHYAAQVLHRLGREDPKHLEQLLCL